MGSANVKSKTEKESEDTKVLNLNVSINLKQNTTMTVVHTYRNLTSENIEDFEDYFITEVVEKNNSLNKTESQLK